MPGLCVRQRPACGAGGAQDLREGNCYYDAMAHMVRWAMHDYDTTGEVFPIHFTCLGWEAAAVFVTDNPYILSALPGDQLCCNSNEVTMAAAPCRRFAAVEQAAAHANPTLWTSLVLNVTHVFCENLPLRHSAWL